MTTFFGWMWMGVALLAFYYGAQAEGFLALGLSTVWLAAGIVIDAVKARRFNVTAVYGPDVMDAFNKWLFNDVADKIDLGDIGLLNHRLQKVGKGLKVNFEPKKKGK